MRYILPDPNTSPIAFSVAMREIRKEIAGRACHLIRTTAVYYNHDGAAEERPVVVLEIETSQ